VLGEWEIVPEGSHQHAVGLLHQSQLLKIDLKIINVMEYVKFSE